MMKLKASLVLAVVAMAAAGCTVNGATIAPTPAASAAAGGGATVGAGAGATVGGVGSGATAEIDADLVAQYKLGRKWVYTMSGTGLSGALMTWEVVKLEANKATVKTTLSNLPGGITPAPTEFVVDLTTAAGPTQLGTKDYNVEGDVKKVSESVTVPAGTYAAAVKYSFVGTSKQQQTGASATLKQDVTFWYDKGVGLVKQITKSQINASTGYVVLQLPGGVTIPGGLPGGVSIPGLPTTTSAGTTGGVSIDTTTTLELKEVTP